MQIAIVSGKGGAGKTIICLSLAYSLKSDVTVLDADVEEPDISLLAQGTSYEETKVEVKVPVVDQQKCTSCRSCITVCKWNALALVPNNKVLVFEDLCRSCTTCWKLCPSGAITVKEKVIGVIRHFTRRNVHFKTGILKVGEQFTAPIIWQLKTGLVDSIVIIDCPPGAGQNIYETLHKVDFCIIIVEPTRFGIFDFYRIYEVIKQMGIPAGIIVNKKRGSIENLKQELGLPVLLEIPFQKDYYSKLSPVRTLVDIDETYYKKFRELYMSITAKNWKNI
ncbi:MAG: P-loop NTPase [Candidatus Hydrogenedentota bacterium]